MSQKKICTCGKTKTPPYCDLAHESLDQVPEAEAMPKKRTVCTCGKSKTFPYCDHSHEHLKCDHSNESENEPTCPGQKQAEEVSQ